MKQARENRLYRLAMAWWLRMHRHGARAGRRYMEGQQRRAEARVLAYLDERTLRDIGLESWSGEVGRHIDAFRRQDALAWRAALGGYGAGALR